MNDRAAMFRRNEELTAERDALCAQLQAAQEELEVLRFGTNYGKWIAARTEAAELSREVERLRGERDIFKGAVEEKVYELQRVLAELQASRELVDIEQDRAIGLSRELQAAQEESAKYEQAWKDVLVSEEELVAEIERLRGELQQIVDAPSRHLMREYARAALFPVGSEEAGGSSGPANPEGT